MNIHTDSGIVKGVFGWPAIHVRKAGEEDKPTLKNIFVDIGCNSLEDEFLEKGVHVGSVMTFEDELTELE